MSNDSDLSDKQKKRILLAEDDTFISKALTLGLKKVGFDIVNSSNGRETLEKMKIDDFDLLLLDLMMPDMDGFTVLDKLREEGLIDSVPIIVLSNLGQQSDIKKCEEYGVKDYLIKADYTIAEIVEKINKVI